MPRCHIYHKPTGTLLTRDLYRHRYPWLVDAHDCHEWMPAGSFVEVNNQEWIRASGDSPGMLLLGRESLVELPRGPWSGCCGPMGEHKNVLAPDEETPVAWEHADCWMSHYICVEAGEWELEQIGDEDGVCWVAWIQHQGRRQLLRAAYGRGEAEAKKRLIPAAQKRLEQEAGAGSQPGQILNARIEIEDLENFARAMCFDPNADKAEVKWLFRKYGNS